MTSPIRLAPALLLVFLVAACSGAAAPAPSGDRIASPDAAAARVAQLYPQFAGIRPQDPDVIGQCCWWEAAAQDGGYEVRIHVGWGDCPAGCINRHEWTFAVASTGAVSLTDESGAALPSGVLPGGGGPGVGGQTGITGNVTAGPTCPVARPDDPACNLRPVGGATISVRTADGALVARVTSEPDGTYTIGLPPGRYVVEATQAEGLTRSTGPADVAVKANRQTVVDLVFDTGIR
ncbi:MAG: collagen binding domain-containing protein [Chloroflexota bacterium]